MLHTVAAYYPDRPSETDKCSARSLVQSLAALYPCSHCKHDFQENVRINPPKVATREKFSKWVCEQHNIVNEKIGKPKYSCDLPKLDERWKVGTAACKMAWDQGDKDTASGSLGQWDEED